MKFSEEKLEKAIVDNLKQQSIDHLLAQYSKINQRDIIRVDDLFSYLEKKYSKYNITENEKNLIINKISKFPYSDLYNSNKSILELISNGFNLRREKKNQKDFLVELIDTAEINNNVIKFVTQLEIKGLNNRVPDGIIYINGIPLIIFEFKSAIRENADIYQAYKQVTIRYKRDIPELLKYNAFIVISDGINNKVGSLFSPYEFFYSWRRINLDDEIDEEDSLKSLIKGLFDINRLTDVIKNFIYFPDISKKNQKIVCRYPQYYAAKILYKNIIRKQKPHGNGKGGTYFGATGSGKSYSMLFLSRLLMKSLEFSSPTIIIISDRTDLDDQLSGQFLNSKKYIGDEIIKNVKDREQLKQLLKNRKSGGIFLTTIQKFTKDINLLSKRNNIICISDEAHRTQINLEQKILLTKTGVKKTFGFAKYLHESLPNATYVGFTGTPIDKTLDVFGKVADTYTMHDSVKDGITVNIAYEGRAAKVLLNKEKLKLVEKYYSQCFEDGANQYQIEKSKKSSAQLNTILGDKDRIKAISKDFVSHYERRENEKTNLSGKTMFVCSSRKIAYEFYKEIIKLRPDWKIIKASNENFSLSKIEKKEVKPIEKIKMVMTRDKDDELDLYDLLGDKKYRKELDKHFKDEKSNFRIAIVVDMWITGFDVPFLDSIYIDKPIKKHNLIQTISRVNRKFGNKEKGIVIDYIGIKKQMNLALAHYSKKDKKNIEEIKTSIKVVYDQLKLLHKLFKNFKFDSYFKGKPSDQLKCLKNATEHIQKSSQCEKSFILFVKRLKAAYDVCNGSEIFKRAEKDYIYL